MQDNARIILIVHHYEVIQINILIRTSQDNRQDRTVTARDEFLTVTKRVQISTKRYIILFIKLEHNNVNNIGTCMRV